MQKVQLQSFLSLMSEEVSLENIQNFMLKLAAEQQKQLSSPFYTILGMTGSGKSTLLNCLLGNEIQFIKQKLGKYSTKIIKSNGNAPEIGNSNTSCTTLASLYNDGQGRYFYDCAGLHDTKGVLQDILNCIANSSILKKSCRIKIILVIQMSSIDASRGRIFTDMAKYLSSLFGQDYNSVVSQMLVVISKAGSDIQLEDIRDIMMESKGLQQTTRQCKFMLHSLLQKNHFLLFPKPSPNFQSNLKKIKATVFQQNHTVIAEDAQIALTDNSKYALIQMKNRVVESLNIFLKQVKDYIDEQFSKIPKKQDLKNKMKYLKQALETVTPLSSKSIDQKQYIDKIGQTLRIIKTPEQVIAKIQSTLNLLDFCAKIGILKNPISPHSKIKEMLDIVGNQFEKIFIQNASKQEIAELQKNYKEIQQQMEQKHKKQVAEIQKNNKMVLSELQQQKRKLQQDYKKFEEEQNKKFREQKKQLENKKQEMEIEHQREVEILQRKMEEEKRQLMNGRQQRPQNRMPGSGTTDIYSENNPYSKKTEVQKFGKIEGQKREEQSPSSNFNPSSNSLYHTSNNTSSRLNSNIPEKNFSQVPPPFSHSTPYPSVNNTSHPEYQPCKNIQIQSNQRMGYNSNGYGYGYGYLDKKSQDQVNQLKRQKQQLSRDIREVRRDQMRIGSQLQNQRQRKHY